jgi:heavy metal translocating P-type ATPase
METGADSSSPERTPSEDFADDLSEELLLRVSGMWCAACSWVIEESLRRSEGIADASVSFLSDMVRIRYLPHRTSSDEIIIRISNLGYHASLFQDQSISSRDKKDLLLRLGISSILTMNVMMVSYALYFGFFQDLGPNGVEYMSYPIWVMATPVVFFGGFPIFRRAWSALRFGNATMDTLISIGSLSAYFYSVIQVRSGSIHLYFDTAAMLVTMVLLGKYIETRAREKVSSGIDQLFQLVSGKARLWIDGRERWVSSDAVSPGDELLVRTGERVPVDACIIIGRAAMDESILTGESRPVVKSPGEDVMSGALVLDGELEIRATRVAEDSSVSQIITLLQEALARKNLVELFADRVTRWFVPAIIILALGIASCLLVRGQSLDEALLRAVTVLVITCPCALGIAVPLAKMASMEEGRANGILIREPSALERAKDLNVIIFDKTGTLTKGSFSLLEIVAAEGEDEETLRRVASVEAHSDHFLAKEIVRKAREMDLDLQEVSSFELFDGLGVKGVVEGVKVVVGNRQLMSLHESNLPPVYDQRASQLEAEGTTVVFFAWDNKVRGLLAFGDTLRERAKGVTAELQSRGVSIRLVSGDSKETTGTVARELGIDRFEGQALPQDKVAIVKGLQETGYRVGMVGDGINDAAALAQADVGFALCTGASLLREASDIALLTDDLSKILQALDLSKIATKITRQNLLFAYCYNTLAIPLAVIGVLNPLIAVLAMFGSSLTVIGNTLRISRTLKL